jgi:hypothetical protein
VSLAIASPQVVARRNSPEHGCPSKMPAPSAPAGAAMEGHPNRRRFTPVYCELERGHAGMHICGQVRWS